MPQSCPSCRAPISSSDAFCPSCGHLLQTPSRDQQGQQQRQQETRPYRPAQVARPPQRQTGQRSPQRPQPQPQPQLPPSSQQGPPPRPSRPWHQKKRFTLPLVFLALLLAVGGVATWFINGQLSTFNDFTSPGSDTVPGQALAMAEDGRGEEWGIIPPTDPGGTTMLMMGVDARDGESVDFGVRADSLSVLHLDGGTCRTLSIPRDTRALLPGYGMSKINHALSVGGVEYQTLVVEQLLGIEIDHFTLIDFDGMAGVVDAIGGVTVTTDHELTYEGVTVPAGTSTINGEQALVFSRFRDDAEGDFGRQRRQQELIQAILRQMNPLEAAQALPTVLTDLDGHLKTDLRAGGVASTGFGFLRGCTASGIENAGLDGAVGNDWDDLEGMELSFVHVADSEIASKVGWLTNGRVAGQLPEIVALTDDRRGRASSMAPFR